MSQSFRIRPAQPDDFTAIQALNHLLFLYEKSFSSTYNHWWMYQPAGIDYFLNRLLNRDSRSVLLVAEANTEVIGYLAGHLNRYSYRLNNPLAEIENMFVLAEYRGRGVGTALVKEFFSQAKKLGAKNFKVEAFAQNQPALDFYQQFDFSPQTITLETNKITLDTRY